jgi:hypothetical protein
MVSFCAIFHPNFVRFRFLANAQIIRGFLLSENTISDHLGQKSSNLYAGNHNISRPHADYLLNYDVC